MMQYVSQSTLDPTQTQVRGRRKHLENYYANFD
uniref:Uncharacterized protein n=1 Tax=Arundo donax TaxID=35708 RepID=A0A0A8Y8R5_ARUDO